MTRLEHDIAVTPQHFARECTDRLFVFHEQDRFPPRAIAAVWSRRRLNRERPRRRQVDLEDRALTRLAVAPDVAAALLDHAVYGRQPEPAPLALFLGREEWLEHTRPRRGVHPLAGIADGE